MTSNSEGGNPNSFDGLMHQAQVENGRGHFTEAMSLYAQASYYAPDNLGVGRALRGNAAATYHVHGYDEAIVAAEKAFTIHDKLVNPNSFDTKVLRERAQSATVVGTFALGEFCDVYIDIAQRNPDTQEERLFRINRLEEVRKIILGKFSIAQVDLDEIRQHTGQIDQHEINFLSRYAATLSLTGDEIRGSQVATEAIQLGWKSESPNILNSNPRLSARDIALAKIRAVTRGVIAKRVSTLASSVDYDKRLKARKLTRRWIV